MYCPQCRFTSFDHLSACPNCGSDWQKIKSDLNLDWLHSTGWEWFPKVQNPESGDSGSSAYPTHDSVVPSSSPLDGEYPLPDSSVQEAGTCFPEDRSFGKSLLHPLIDGSASKDVDQAAPDEDHPQIRNTENPIEHQLAWDVEVPDDTFFQQKTVPGDALNKSSVEQVDDQSALVEADIDYDFIELEAFSPEPEVLEKTVPPGKKPSGGL
jgi:hypothetical protein